MSDYVRIQVRRDTFVNWANVNPVLALGEPSLDITNKVIRIGDGVTAWNDLDVLPIGAKYSVIAGGTTGQVLAKASNDDYDTEWTDQTGGDGGGGLVDSVNGQIGEVVLDAEDVGADQEGAAAAAIVSHEGSGTPVHTMDQITDLLTELANYSELEHIHDIDDLNVSGTANNLSFLRGDGQWAVPPTQDADEVPFTPFGNIEATNVQDALEELDTEKATSIHHHDDRYYTQQQADSVADGKADADHIHVRKIFETAQGVWTGDIPARPDYVDPIELVGVSDPTDATNGVDTPANLARGDKWFKTAAYI